MLMGAESRQYKGGDKNDKTARREEPGGVKEREKNRDGK